MDPRDEVEFVTDDGSVIDVEDDDVVDFAPRRAPSWVLGLCAGVVGVAVILAIAWRGAPEQASAPDAAVVPSVIALPTAPPTSQIGDPLPVPSGFVLDVAVSGDSFYALQVGRLTVTTPAINDTASYPGAHHVSAGGLKFTTASSARLVLDDAAHRLWVVVYDLPGGQLLEFDARTLVQLRGTNWAEPVSSAAALGGHLFLATPSGIVDYAPGHARPAAVPGLRGHSGTIAADPSRGRLLVLDEGSPSRVLAMRPDGSLSPAIGTAPLGNGRLGITADGSIWAGGFSDSGAVLLRLDPRTLEPVSSSPLAALGAGALIEAVGSRSIWVRSGGGRGGLWCVDSRTGRERQFWHHVPGAVTSQRGVAYVASGEIIRPLVLAGCRG